MSNSNRNLRVHVLAAATALALTAVAAPAFAGKAYMGSLKSDGQYHRFIVKYKNGSAPTTSSASMTSSLSAAAARTVLPASAKGKKLGLKHLRRMSLGAEVVSSEAALTRVEAEALMRQIAADPNVEYVEPDMVVKALVVPNDARFGEQYDLANSAVGINMPTAWNTSNGTGIVVAVVDSGIVTHTDLSANILPGYDMISTTSGLGFGSCGSNSTCGASQDGNGRDTDPTDSSAATTGVHGTHVAGTIAALTNNATGVAGIAYGAKVVPVRVLGKDGNGSLADIADGIVWASGGSVAGAPANANPADVINLSLGGDLPCSETPTWQAAVNTAVANGSIVVAAAGNSNIDVSGASPAGCNNVISVAASDHNGNRSYFSSYGATIDITAPGGELCSPPTEFLPLGTNPVDKCTTFYETNGILSTVGGNGYDFYHGTSMAAPHVSGVIALMQAASATPKTTSQVLSILASTARPITAAKCPGGCGPGLIDAAAAVAAVGGGTPGNVAPVANFTSSASGLTVSFTDTSTDSDGSIASRSWSFGDGTNSTSANPSKTYSAAGTYTVSLTVTDNSGATHTKTSSVTVSSSSSNVRQTYTNSGDYTIVDNSTAVESPITVSGRTGNAPSDTSLAVNIVHTYRGDLVIDLIAPDGSAYNLANRAGSSGGINKTITVSNLTSEALNGTWKLRVRDAAANDVGYINSWSITF
ncbi:S8 family serine peptidase [Lysobacter sp. Root983]|uniref:S8 family serine peptidase n=2 Tax=Lysobacter sp. Root983 TaxID=1736613 RepID=UPI0009E7FB41|nr:S8 family serine peptidase [Lysobacter sp. Root983]